MQKLDFDGDGFWSDYETNKWTEIDHKYYDLSMNGGRMSVTALLIFPLFSLIYSAIIINALYFWKVFTRRKG
ncbi:MAG: hypothetical protein AB8D52_11390 [Gammaproteobacteria bacterium]